MRKRNTGQGDRTDVSVEAERNPFEHLPGRAHPGAQCRRVGRSLVMRMVRGVGHRLGIHQPAEEEETDSQADCDGSPAQVVHWTRFWHMTSLVQPEQSPPLAKLPSAWLAVHTPSCPTANPDSVRFHARGATVMRIDR